MAKYNTNWASPVLGLDPAYSPPVPVTEVDEATPVEGIFLPGVQVNEGGSPRVIIGYVVVLSQGGRVLAGGSVLPGSLQYRRDIRSHEGAVIVASANDNPKVDVREWVAREMHEPISRLSTLLYRANTPHVVDGETKTVQKEFFYFYAEEAGDYGPTPVHHVHADGQVGEGGVASCNDEGRTGPRSRAVQPRRSGDRRGEARAHGHLRGFEFMEIYREAVAEKGTSESLTVAKDVKTGKVSTIVGVTVEHHEDADGSYTIWVNTEEM